METKYIIIQQKEVYGNTTYYPQCNISKALAKLAGTKTLTRQALGVIQNELGYQIRHVPIECDYQELNIVQGAA